MPLSTPSFSAPRRRLLIAALVAALLLLHAWLALSASREKSATVDEVAHLTGGLAYWQYNDYRLHPENGNLPQRWAALPAWLGGLKLPADHPGWTRANVWGLGRDYFRAQGGRLEALWLAGRAMNLIWSLGTGLLVWAWARQLFGLTGAFVALGFFAFCPTFLAHGALATSDLCMTFFMLASVTAYGRHLQDFHWRTGLLSAVVLGLACVAKFSFGLLPFMFLPLFLWRMFSRQDLPWRGRALAGPWERIGPLLLSATGHVLVAWLLVWLFFGFRHGAAGPGLPGLEEYHRPWSTVIASLGTKGRVLEVLRHWSLLPDAFLYGFAFVADMAQMRGAFLNGEYSLTGWPQFFPSAFLMKTPLPLLAGLLATGVVAGGRWLRRPAVIGSDLGRTAPLLALFTVYWGFSIAGHLNIGHRHILPVYPVLFIATGALGWRVMRHPRRGPGLAAIFVLLAAHATASMQVRPHYLAFFNQLVGGPRQGYRHLVDSSLDWGQDLPGLAGWLRAHANGAQNPPRVYFSYFGTADPAHYEITTTLLPTLPSIASTRPWHPLQPGVYVISATMLSHVYSSLRGPWTGEWEREYQALRALEPALLYYAGHPAERNTGPDAATPAEWQQTWTRYEELRFARLCHHLRAREPDDQIGYSLLIYRLDQAELDRALR